MLCLIPKQINVFVKVMLNFKDFKNTEAIKLG